MAVRAETWDENWVNRWTVYPSGDPVDTVGVAAGAVRIPIAGTSPAGVWSMVLMDQPLGDFQSQAAVDVETAASGFTCGLALATERRLTMFNRLCLITLKQGPTPAEVNINAIDYSDGAVQQNVSVVAARPATLAIERYGAEVQLFYIVGDTKTEVMRVSDFPANEVGYLSLFSFGAVGAGGAGLFSSVSTTFKSPMTEFLWNNMPSWYRSYPLRQSASGDLALTPNGGICLLQDIVNELDLSRGELIDHPEKGAGLRAFFGEAFTDDTQTAMFRQIKTALRSDGIGQRLLAGKELVEIEELTTELLTTAIGVTPSDGTDPLNLVLEIGESGLTKVVESTAPTYDSETLGRDLYLNRDTPFESDAEAEASLNYLIVETVGLELDRAMLSLVEVRDAATILRAGGDYPVDNTAYTFVHIAPDDRDYPADATGLDFIAPFRLLERNLGETTEYFRARLSEEFGKRQRDGTLTGLVERCEDMGFTSVSLVEGWRDDFYTVMAALGIDLDDGGVDRDLSIDVDGTVLQRRIRRRRAELHLVLTPPVAGIAATFLEFHRFLLEHQRAGRRICYHIDSPLPDWADIAWSDWTFTGWECFET